MKTLFQAIMCCLIVFYSANGTCQLHQNNLNTGVKFTVKLTSEFGGDTLRLDTLALVYYENAFFSYTDLNTPHSEIIAAKSADGYFHFSVPDVKAIKYFSLGQYKMRRWGYDNQNKRNFYTSNDFSPILEMYIMEPNDDITITLTGYNHPLRESDRLFYNAIFEGAGSAKYTCRFQTDNFQDFINFGAKSNPLLYEGHYLLNNTDDERRDIGINLIESYKNLLTDISLNILKADLFSKTELGKYNVFRGVASEKAKDSNSLKLFAKEMAGQKEIYISPEAKTISRSYSEMRIERFFLQHSTSLSGALKNDSNIFNEIYSLQDIKLREKMMTTFLLHWDKLSPHLFSLVQKSLVSVKNPLFLQRINNINHLRIGNAAFNFSFSDINGKIVKLSDFRNKVVFMDFWYVGCTACAKYYKYELSAVEKSFKSNPKVVFLTVSLDNDLPQWNRGLESGNFTSNDAINLYTNGLGWRHEIVAYYNITGAPFPLLIDSQGNIFQQGDILRSKEKLSEIINQALAQKNN